METEFAIAAFELQVKSMSEEEAKEMLLYLHKCYLTQQNAFKDLIKKQLGITPEEEWHPSDFF